ncbi:MAG: hypothetical protein R3E32_04910 [Chitinophagales bacterium]
MKKNILYFFFFVFFLSSCCPSGKDNEYKKVATALQQSVPYASGQTVKFVGSDGNSYSLNVKRTLEETHSDFNKCSGQTLEFFNVELKNSEATPLMRFGTNYTTDEQMTIELLTKQFQGGAQYYLFQYFVNEDGSFQCGEKFNFIYTCHESIEIAGKTYFDVLEINQKELDPNGENNVLRLFYSQNKGVIQYEFENGVIYSMTES